MIRLQDFDKTQVEQVGIGHPDRFCDYVSELILEYFLFQKNDANVAVECIAKKYYIQSIIETNINPENRKKTEDDIKKIITIAFWKIYKNFEENQNHKLDIKIDIHHQSAEIESKTKKEKIKKAGDNGIIYGFAVNNEKCNYLPKTMFLANELYRKLVSGGWSDFKFIYNDSDIYLSLHNPYKLPKPQFKIKNRIIEYSYGGINADVGLTGRKIQCDCYLGNTLNGGGNLWGKDPGKVDKSGKIYARWLAKKIVKKFSLPSTRIKLIYIIGRDYPNIEYYIRSSVKYDKDLITKYIEKNLLSVQEIINKFELNTYKFSKTLYKYGNIFMDKNSPWEK